MWSQTPHWLQAAHYQNVPHNQVDWATLAKQWISMQQQQTPPIPMPPTGPPPPPPPPPPLPAFVPIEMPPDLNKFRQWPPQPPRGEPSKPSYSRKAEPRGSRDTQDSESPWENPPPMIARQIVDYAHNPSGSPRPSALVKDYGHGDKSKAPEPRVVDYGHGYSQDSTSSRSPEDESARSGSTPAANSDSAMALDAMKRKNLPAWIRDGLEKMEREKLRKKEADEAAGRRSARKKPLWAEEDEEEEQETNSSEKLPEPSVSKEAESDEELPDDEDAIVESEPKAAPPVSIAPTPIFRTQEEREQQFALNVKRFMTEILMSVITTELNEIVDDEIQRARQRVTAKPKKVTVALANIVGLGGYSDSDASDNETPQKDESDSDLETKVAARRRDFRRWEENRMLALEEKESEQQKRMQRNQSTDDKSPDRSKSRSRERSSRADDVPSAPAKDRSTEKHAESSNDSRVKEDRRRRRESSSNSSDSSDRYSRKSKRSDRYRTRRRSRSRSRSSDHRRARSGSRDRRKRSTSRDRRRDRSRDRRRDRSRDRSSGERTRGDRSRSHEQHRKYPQDSRKYDRSYKRR